MKLFVEKLPISNDNSFVARTHTTPLFEVPWHQHREIELIMITRGTGLSFIGNYVGDFEPGDIFFLGSDLPHTFQKNGNAITSAIIIQFTEDFWGSTFLQLPESRTIKKLLINAKLGYKVTGSTRNKLAGWMHKIAQTEGFERIIFLCECLNTMAASHEITHLSTQDLKLLGGKNKARIDRVFKYTMEKFKEPIQLVEIARVANMSIPAFCNYFKKTTRKRYIDFVNEIRIGYSCQLLIDSEDSIAEICYKSGFNTVANFNKQFLRLKKITPSKFRRAFTNTSLSTSE